jgi:hypothetical protein
MIEEFHRARFPSFLLSFSPSFLPPSLPPSLLPYLPLSLLQPRPSLPRPGRLLSFLAHETIHGSRSFYKGRYVALFFPPSLPPSLAPSRPPSRPLFCPLIFSQ